MCLCFPIALTACSNGTLVPSKFLTEKPKVRSTNLSNSLMCVKKAIGKSEDRTNGYLFSIPPIIDGTVIKGVDGELSDSLQYEFISNLHNVLPRGYGLVLTNHPIVFQETDGNSDFGLNQYGVINKSDIESLTKVYLEQINSTRKIAQKTFPNEKISLYDKLHIRIIKGAFTRNDKDPVHKKGFGLNIGGDGSSGDGAIDFGKTNEYSSITLSLLLNDPSSNILQNATSFTINAHRFSSNFELSLTPGEGLLGLVNENLVIESKHGAQQTLIDAATIWVLEKTYGDKADFSKCIS